MESYEVAITGLVRLRGSVQPGSNNAEGNFRHLLRPIADRSGLPHVIPGTLNVALDKHFPVTAVTDVIGPTEYDHQRECIKLQRCRIGRVEGSDGLGVRGVIVRPSQHEDPRRPHWMRVEVMSPHDLRDTLVLPDETGVWIEVEGERFVDNDWWGREESLPE